jgi:hypothetical protein
MAEVRGQATFLRSGLAVVVLCCCAALTACTAATPKGPAAAVTTPAVGQPVPPASAQAALSSEAFTPYAGLGSSTDDGLAPGDTYEALHTACLNDAGYGQYASTAAFAVRENRGLAFAQAYGPWGYLGATLAAQEGFEAPVGGAPGSSPTGSLPTQAQAAANKCFNIVLDFNNTQFARSMAGIETMNDDISSDVVQDTAFKRATKAWLSCIARSGYTASDPSALAQQEEQSLGQLNIGPNPSPSPSTSASAEKAQLAAAVADADCTQSTDLAGIYFAVQASYEQQFVSANQQELNQEVREYKAAFAKELNKLPGLLRTASAKPLFPSGVSRAKRP